MANDSAERFLSSLIPDIEYADAPQDYCDLQISVFQETDPKLNCLRMSLAPTENCPAEMPPAIAGQLDCDEQCPERRKAPVEVASETAAEKPAPARVLRVAA